MKLKINKLYIVFGLISLSIMIMAIAGIWVGGNFTPIISWTPLKELPNELPKTGAWIPVAWTFPFYFTIQSNVLVILYFGLIGFGVINSNQNKKALIYELITLTNISITAIVFWTVLSENTMFVRNIYLLIENLGLHAFVPLMMIITWSWKTFVSKKQEVFLEYKDFWKFLIYPIIWLVMAIIVYYSSRVDVVYLRSYKFQNETLAKTWVNHLTQNNIQAKLIGTSEVQSFIAGIWGNAIYFFLNFDYVPAWITIIIILVIAVLFAMLALLFISINKSDSKIYKFLILKRGK